MGKVNACAAVEAPGNWHMKDKQWIAMALTLVWLVTVGTWISCRRDTPQGAKPPVPTATTERDPAPTPETRRDPAPSDASDRAARRKSKDAAPNGTRSGKKRKADADPDESVKKRAGSGKPPADKGKSSKRGGQKQPSDRNDREENDADGAASEMAIEFTRIPAWSTWEAANANENFIMGFVLGDPTAGKQAPKLTVFHTVGGEGRAAAVIERMIEKFASNPTPLVKRAQMPVDGLQVEMIDIVGLYEPGEGKDGRPDNRIFCALIEHRGGLTLVKTIGPNDEIEQHKDDIVDMIRSVRKK